MRKFIGKILLYAIIVVMADKMFGTFLGYCRANAKGGEIYSINRVFYEATPDVLILGSSRAYHHIVPQILEDSLGLTCLNAGYDASSIIPQFCRYEMMSRRHKPQLVIYEVYSGNDIYVNPNISTTNGLEMYYDNPIIANVLDEVKPNDKFKMASMLYRYNSQSLSILKNFLIKSDINKSGYKPFHEVLDYEPILRQSLTRTSKVDTIKIKYIYKLIESTKKQHIKLVFTVAPWYHGGYDEEYSLIRKICRDKDVSLLYHQNETLICNNRKYFKDPGHLNHTGAQKYTKIVASEIKKML